MQQNVQNTTNTFVYKFSLGKNFVKILRNYFSYRANQHNATVK